MNKLLEPLNDTELAALDLFLLDRIDEDEETDEADVGLLSVSELDGLFTALVSGPELAPPSEWLPIVWGDFEPEWESEEDFEAPIGLMMRHMNTIAATLMEAPEEFDPLFLQVEENGETFVIVDDWCEGYMRGVALTTDAWRAGGTDMEHMLAPVLAFTSLTHWQGHELASEAEVEQLSDTIAPNVRAIHAYWLLRRKPEPTPSSSPWGKPRNKH